MSTRGTIRPEEHVRAYGAQPERIKKYVDVVSLTTSDGLVTPRQIIWEDGRRYTVHKVLDRRQAHSLKTGGTGMRYTVQVGKTQTYLYYDDYRHAWFVEAKRVMDANWDA